MNNKYKEVYDLFWKELVENEDGSLNKDAMMRELSDYKFLLDEVPKVYCYVTGEKLSKPHYKSDIVIAAFEDHYSDLTGHSYG